MVEYCSGRHAGLRSMPPVLARGQDWSGRAIEIYDDYVATGAEAAGSTILLGRIPGNCRVVDGWIKYTAAGAGVTLDVGVASDGDKFFNDVAISAAGLTRMTATDGMGWLNAGNDPVNVFATTAGGALTAGAVITLHITVQGL